MLLADGNGGYIEPVISPTPVGEILDGISTTSASIVTPTPTPIPIKPESSFTWLWWVLLVAVAITAVWYFFKKIKKA
jgi:hypothetical protein